MNDTEIISLFFERSERAITELSDKYGKLLFHVANNILGSREDAEECVNDTYLAVWNAIPPEHPASLLSYACRIVKMAAINRYHKNSAVKRSGSGTVCIDELEEMLADTSGIDDKLNADELTEQINSFLAVLSNTDRVLFVRRFWYLDDYGEIANMYGMKEGAVRTRLSRIRAKLKKYLLKNGVIL